MVKKVFFYYLLYYCEKFLCFIIGNWFIIVMFYIYGEIEVIFKWLYSCILGSIYNIIGIGLVSNCCKISFFKFNDLK